MTMHIFHSLELLHSIPISLYSLCVHSCTSIYKFQSVVYCLVDIESVPLVAHYLSQPLVCTSTVWSTPLSTTGMHIHRVEHTSLNHWYAHPPCGAHLSQPLVCTSTVWSTPLSTTGIHIHRVEHTSLNHWYAHPPCGAHLSQPLVCTSTVWSTPLSATCMHIHRVEHTSLSHWYVCTVGPTILNG